MEFGIFDHLDHTGMDLRTQYAQRLELAALYDELGFYAYHLAEHHSTPLGMSPSPSVFLSAVIQRTRRLRIGPLVYLLPLYHPLRLIEEVCMLLTAAVEGRSWRVCSFSTASSRGRTQSPGRVCGTASPHPDQGLIHRPTKMEVTAAVTQCAPLACCGR